MMMRRYWTPNEIETLRHLYPDTPTWEIARQLGRTVRSIFQQANSIGVRKSQKFLASPASGRLRPGANIGGKTKFKHGHAPWNKGKQFDAGGRSSETRFKKGSLAGNARALLKPLGYERINKDGIRERKTTMDGPPHKRWEAIHRIIWREANGPIPNGSIIRYIDGDHNNITLENLEIVTRAENAVLNTIKYNDYSPEIKPSVLLVTRIELQRKRLTERTL